VSRSIDWSLLMAIQDMNGFISSKKEEWNPTNRDQLGQ
jgi:hypothetical protein